MRAPTVLRLVVVALACALGALVLRETSAAAAGCTGVPAEDAAIEGCGLLLHDITQLTWSRPDTPVAVAFAAHTMSLPDGAAPAADSLEVWTQHPRSGQWLVWAPRPRPGLLTFKTLAHGQAYWIVTTQDIAWSWAVERPSYFEAAQVVSLYGHPGVPFLGALGKYSASEAAAEAARVAATYDAVNGDRGVIPALHLIASVAQAHPGDGTYLGRMSLPAVQVYVDETRRRGMLLFLDIQVGWGDPLEEVRRYERFLAEAHVHVALDPEFATRSDGVPPGQAIGSLTGAQINQVQEYLAALGQAHGLPPRILVVHQFRDDMIEDPGAIASVDGVDLVIDMDGFGPQFQKRWGYNRYAHSTYAEYAGFKLFYEWDTPLLTPREVLSLSPGPPDYVIYQ